jgi:hypothetical protein
MSGTAKNAELCTQHARIREVAASDFDAALLAKIAAGAWGKGRCEFCGRSLDEVLSRPAPQPATMGVASRG